jgi:hypothetical protein
MSSFKEANKVASDLESLRGKPLFTVPVECNTAFLRPTICRWRTSENPE